jgi:hypothetical protein
VICKQVSTFRIYAIVLRISKPCRKQEEVMQNHENEYVRSIGQGGATHRKYMRLKFGGG